MEMTALFRVEGCDAAGYWWAAGNEGTDPSSSLQGISSTCPFILLSHPYQPPVRYTFLGALKARIVTSNLKPALQRAPSVP